MLQRWLGRAAAVWALLHLLMLGEGVVDDEDVPFTNQQFNFASHTAGAVIIDKSPPDARGFHNLLNDDKDKYGLWACSGKKWVVIGLAEDIVITSVTIANYEKYSSMLKSFQLLASTAYPTNDWIDLGTYTAELRLGEQSFNLTTKPDIHTRFLKVKFLSHYLDESLCTLSQIKVYGVTVIASLKEEVEMSRDHLQMLRKDEERSASETILVNLVPPANGHDAAAPADSLVGSGTTIGNRSGASPDTEASVTPRTEESSLSRDTPASPAAGASSPNHSEEVASLTADLTHQHEEERHRSSLNNLAQVHANSEVGDASPNRSTLVETEGAHEPPQLPSLQTLRESERGGEALVGTDSQEIDSSARNSATPPADASLPPATVVPATTDTDLDIEANAVIPPAADIAAVAAPLPMGATTVPEMESSLSPPTGSGEDSSTSSTNGESDGSLHSSTRTSPGKSPPDVNEGTDAHLSNETMGVGDEGTSREPISSSPPEAAASSKARPSSSVSTLAGSNNLSETPAQTQVGSQHSNEGVKSSSEQSDGAEEEPSPSNGLPVTPATATGLAIPPLSPSSGAQEGIQDSSLTETSLTDAAPQDVSTLEATRAINPAAPTTASSSSSSGLAGSTTTTNLSSPASTSPASHVAGAPPTGAPPVDSVREDGATPQPADSVERRHGGHDSSSSIDPSAVAPASSSSSGSSSSPLDSSTSDSSSPLPPASSSVSSSSSSSPSPSSSIPLMYPSPPPSTSVPSASPSSLSLQACMELARFLDYHDKMRAKLLAKHEDPMASSTHAVSWKESGNNNIFRQLIQRIKDLETNYVIAESYIAQMSDCMRWMSKDLARLQVVHMEGGDPVLLRPKRFQAQDGAGQGNITIFRVVEKVDGDTLGRVAKQEVDGQQRPDSTRLASQPLPSPGRVAWSSRLSWLEQLLESVRVYTQPRPGFHGSGSPEISSPAVVYRSVIEKYWVEVMMALVAIVSVWSGVAVLAVGYLVTRQRK